jgi:tetratricopeptide (TPR) repeat protein
LLIYGAAAKGGEILETGISLLSSENTVLKVLCSQILALMITPHTEKSSYYQNIVLTECVDRPSLYAFFKAIQEDDCADEKENRKALRQPLILLLALKINSIGYYNDLKEVMHKLGFSISKLQKEVEAEAQNDRLYLPLLFIVENTLARIKVQQESPAALQLALDNFIEENGRLNPDTAKRYYTIGRILRKQKNYDASLKFHYEALDIRLELYGKNSDTAKSYLQIGYAQYGRGDYESALQSFEKVLAIGQNIHGKTDPDIARACSIIGATKYHSKEYDSAMHWLQQALDIRVALYGKEHPASAQSYYWIAECQYEMQDYDSALDSCQQALDIRLMLFGQENEDTNNSYRQMELIRSKKPLSYFKKKNYFKNFFLK